MRSSATLLSALLFKDKVEEVTGKTINPTKLQEAILLVNHRRRVLQRINRLRAVQPVPISGRDVLLANQLSFYDDPIFSLTNLLICRMNSLRSSRSRPLMI
jgi:benzoyl-CoA reductase/2-hydroxyglutaryl-CoA dehydratase subunit BcrC/BadD/HgdB